MLIALKPERYSVKKHLPVFLKDYSCFAFFFCKGRLFVVPLKMFVLGEIDLLKFIKTFIQVFALECQFGRLDRTFMPEI